MDRRSFLKIVGITAAGTQVPLELVASEDYIDDWNETGEWIDEEYTPVPRRESVWVEDDHPVKPGEIVMRLDIDDEAFYYKLGHTVLNKGTSIEFHAVEDFQMTPDRDICLNTAHIKIGDFPYKWVDLQIDKLYCSAGNHLTLQFDANNGFMRIE